MVGITYGIQPYGDHPLSWTNPRVLSELGAGLALLIAFAVIERRVAHPMFRMPLFRIRAFTFGVLSSFLAAVARGRTDVHADHLAAGHLAAPARLQLHRNAAMGSIYCFRSPSGS